MVVIAGRGGVRERKKQQTRATLIDAAVDLCERQGYERTTVEQIAAAAAVTSRTFSRYFGTKEAVVLAMVDELVDATAAELSLVPMEMNPLEALLVAHVHVLNSAQAGGGKITALRLVRMLNIVNAVPALQGQATIFRRHAITLTLANRMGVGLDTRALRLVVETWAAIMLAAVGDLGAGVAVSYLAAADVPALMVDRLTATFSEFAELTNGIGRPAMASSVAG